MASISLCMIVKNEEEVLERCLDSIRDLVDEIIIVDTGSVDETKRIALEYTDKVETFPWIDDFAAARNYAFSRASMDFCMWLDADDVMEEKDRAGFLKLKQSLTPDTDMVMMRYEVAFDEQGAPSFWYYRERLIRNHRGYLWKGAVHEAIAPVGNVVYSDVAVTHRKIHAGDGDRNLNIYRKMLADGKTLEGRERYYYGRELYYHQMYEEAIRTFDMFLKSPDGWVENKIEACLLMGKCHRALGDRQAALGALLESLEYDVPKAELCCEIGAWFMESGQYETAVFWYETALGREMDFKKGGFISPDSYGFIPAMQLCVCYDKLGQYGKAESYNEMAGRMKPESPAVLFNREYFEQRRGEKDEGERLLDNVI